MTSFNFPLNFQNASCVEAIPIRIVSLTSHGYTCLVFNQNTNVLHGKVLLICNLIQLLLPLLPINSRPNPPHSHHSDTSPPGVWPVEGDHMQLPTSVGFHLPKDWVDTVNTVHGQQHLQHNQCWCVAGQHSELNDVTTRVCNMGPHSKQNTLTGSI